MDSLDGLESLGKRVAQSQEDGGATEAEHAFLRERLLIALRASRRRRIAIRALTGLVLGAAATIALLILRRATSGDIDFSVDGAPGKVGDFLPSPDNRSIEVRFTEGTSAVLAPKTRGRVTAVSPYGADVVIEAGKAKMSVVPRPQNRWLVHAGPFVVHVTGTKFQVAWDPAKDKFVLELYEGKVTISGCVFGDGSPIAAGERVEAGCGLAEFRVSQLSPGDGTQATQPGAPDPSATASAPGTPDKARPDWLSMARSGRYAEAFRVAEGDGIDELCAKSSATNLLLLGDAARLSGHPGAAHSVYLALRSRFAGSTSAASAAFYLGRLDLDDKHGGSAKKWLLAYLDEAPDGPLAAAALGRLLEIQIASHDRQSAVALAKQYLDRYPSGPHSAAAEQVLTSDSPHDRR
ncbi:MAG TPA: FecR domain-containing protein [Polyangiaceae bacterium]|jgi:TolA-binding protein|nr:FecR domain-containing protein [Polyangiaceae bacterium]